MTNEDFNKLASSLLEDDIDNIQLDSLLVTCDNKHKHVVSILKDLFEFGREAGKRESDAVKGESITGIKLIPDPKKVH